MALFAIYARFDRLKAANCSSITEHGSKFWEMVGDLGRAAPDHTMDDVWLIFQYFMGLDEPIGDLRDAGEFRDYWLLKHNLVNCCTKEDDAHTLFSVIRACEDWCANPLGT